MAQIQSAIELTQPVWQAYGFSPHVKCLSFIRRGVNVAVILSTDRNSRRGDGKDLLSVRLRDTDQWRGAMTICEETLVRGR